MSIALQHFQSSELNRNSTSVFAAAEKAPVLVTRRDGEDLVLMSERESNLRATLFDFAAQLIAVTLDDRGTLVERMSDRFPWILALKAADRETCAKSLIESARASFATKQPFRIITELQSWQETAEAVAAGLQPSNLDLIDSPELVERPV
jgi:hypothetical protein